MSKKGISTDPEYSGKPKRRKFNSEDKIRILNEIDQNPDKYGFILRREALYSSHIDQWRKWQLKMKNNPKSKNIHNELAKQKRKIASLELKLKKAEAIIDIQKKKIRNDEIRTERKQEYRNSMINFINEHKGELGAKDACSAFGVPESTYYKWISNKDHIKCSQEKKQHHRAYTIEERKYILDIMNSDKFVDKAPSVIYTILLDEGKYLCSRSTMYRILSDNISIKERRDQIRHPEYKKPELIATGPIQVWTWDITKIKTGTKFKYHHLYVIIDMYSRYVVGWAIKENEDAAFARDLIKETCEKQNIDEGQLTLLSDRGAAMKSQTVAQLLSDLSINKSHSRPYVSNDNPFSESQFKTLKYHASYPKEIPTQDEAKIYLRGWFNWYNNEHKHSGIEMLSPVDVHTGNHQKVIKNRQEILDMAYAKTPEKFPRGRPKLKSLNRAVYINKPIEDVA